MFSWVIVVIAVISSAYANTCTITNFNQVASVVASCTTITVGNLAVPAGQTLKLNLKAGSHLTFTGAVTFGHSNWKGPLIAITGDKVTVTGSSSHVLNGEGQLYWDGKGGAGTTKPLFISIQGTGSVYNRLHFKNCPERCVALYGSTNVELENFVIDNAAGAEGVAAKGKEGHNTDGFDIASSHGVTVTNAEVINQDDCVAINSGTNMVFNRMYCKGSHGLSIAAGMGSEYANNIVQNISFRNAVLEGGNAAVRLKTCSDGGPGKVDSITWENIVLKNILLWGISINQDYSWKIGGNTGTPKGNVPITNVRIENLSGHMSTSSKYSTAVTIVCAANACKDIVFKNVTLPKGNAKNNCNLEPTGFHC